MQTKAVRPEDILGDEQNSAIIEGVKVRKGSIGAALANADILASTITTPAEKESALKMIMELAPALVVLGMHKHVIWKNMEVQKILERAAKNMANDK